MDWSSRWSAARCVCALRVSTRNEQISTGQQRQGSHYGGYWKRWFSGQSSFCYRACWMVTNWNDLNCAELVCSAKTTSCPSNSKGTRKVEEGRRLAVVCWVFSRGCRVRRGEKMRDSSNSGKLQNLSGDGLKTFTDWEGGVHTSIWTVAYTCTGSCCKGFIQQILWEFGFSLSTFSDICLWDARSIKTLHLNHLALHFCTETACPSLRVIYSPRCQHFYMD